MLKRCEELGESLEEWFIGENSNEDTLPLFDFEINLNEE